MRLYYMHRRIIMAHWLFFFFFLQPYFDMFYNHVKNLFASDATLSPMEKCALMESLILISNQFKDFAKERAFLDELMSCVVAQWTSEEMKKCVLTSTSFALLLHDKIFSVMSDELFTVCCVTLLPSCLMLELIKWSQKRVMVQTQQVSIDQE